MNYEVEAAENAEVTITTDRDGAFMVANAVFAAYWDGREDREYGEDLRADFQVGDATTAATFTLSDRRASRLADYMKEASRVAEDDDRDATARALSRRAHKIRVAVAFRRGSE